MIFQSKINCQENAYNLIFYLNYVFKELPVFYVVSSEVKFELIKVTLNS